MMTTQGFGMPMGKGFNPAMAHGFGGYSMPGVVPGMPNMGGVAGMPGIAGVPTGPPMQQPARTPMPAQQQQQMQAQQQPQHQLHQQHQQQQHQQQQQQQLPPQSEPVTLALLIPGDSIARVIGKAGAGLKQIRESTGSKIVVQEASANPTSNTRRVDLIGPAANNIGAAAGRVLQQAAAGQGLQTLEIQVLVPNKATGQVIGKGGERLKLVRESTGVRIQVEREAMANLHSGEEERMLTAFGEPLAIGTALSIALGGGRPALAFPGATLFGGGRGFMGASEVHNMPDDPTAIQLHMMIPGKLTGAIVGKQGTTIQQLANQSGCLKLGVTKRTNSSQRHVICIGGIGEVQSAQQLIHSTAMAAAESAGVDSSVLLQVEATFWIPKQFSGAVIGKQGANLGSIREQAGVKVQFGKEEVKEMRPCTIVGPLQNVLDAEDLIYNLLKQEMDVKSPGKGTGGCGPGDQDHRLSM